VLEHLEVDLVVVSQFANCRLVERPRHLFTLNSGCLLANFDLHLLKSDLLQELKHCSSNLLIASYLLC